MLLYAYVRDKWVHRCEHIKQIRLEKQASKMLLVDRQRSCLEAIAIPTSQAATATVSHTVHAAAAAAAAAVVAVAAGVQHKQQSLINNMLLPLLLLQRGELGQEEFVLLRLKIARG